MFCTVASFSPKSKIFLSEDTLTLSQDMESQSVSVASTKMARSSQDWNEPLMASVAVKNDEGAKEGCAVVPMLESRRESFLDESLEHDNDEEDSRFDDRPLCLRFLSNFETFVYTGSRSALHRQLDYHGTGKPYCRDKVVHQMVDLPS